MTENLELREWIAVNVMGWCTHAYTDKCWYSERESNSYSKEAFRPDEDIAAAWLVVEAMAKRGWSNFALSTCVEGWYADFAKPMGAIMRGTASAPQMAICLAAKAALEGAR